MREAWLAERVLSIGPERDKLSPPRANREVGMSAGKPLKTSSLHQEADQASDYDPTAGGLDTPPRVWAHHVFQRPDQTCLIDPSGRPMTWNEFQVGCGKIKAIHPTTAPMSGPEYNKILSSLRNTIMDDLHGPDWRNMCLLFINW